MGISPVAAAKAETRREVQRRLEAVSAEARASKSAEIVRRILELPQTGAARTVFGYYPFGNEVDIRAVLRDVLHSGRRLCLPRVAGSELVFHEVGSLSAGYTVHPWGIREPSAQLPEVSPDDCSGPVLVVVPGVAFDARGTRLGRGRGYYDRFLLRAGREGWLRLGVAFREQICASVPAEAHDVPVDMVLTDAE